MNSKTHNDSIHFVCAGVSNTILSFATMKSISLSLALAVLTVVTASAQVSQEVLDSISTPNEVETSIGTLKFLDGAPLPETAEKVYDYLDTSRAMDTFLKGQPACSLKALIDGAHSIGAQTRSQLQTSQSFPTVGSQTEGIKQNDDGSTDIYFSPKAPEGLENNWLETVPGKSWFVILRMYGPLKPWLDQTWRPSEVELIK